MRNLLFFVKYAAPIFSIYFLLHRFGNEKAKSYIFRLVFGLVHSIPAFYALILHNNNEKLAHLICTSEAVDMWTPRVRPVSVPKSQYKTFLLYSGIQMSHFENITRNDEDHEEAPRWTFKTD